MLFELQLLTLDDFMYLFEWGWDICVFLLTLWDLHVRVMEGHVFWMHVSLDPMKQMTLKRNNSNNSHVIKANYIIPDTATKDQISHWILFNPFF